MKQPDVAQRFTQLGIDAVGSSPEDYGARNRVAYEKFAQIVKATGVKID